MRNFKARQRGMERESLADASGDDRWFRRERSPDLLNSSDLLTRNGWREAFRRLQGAISDG